MRCSKILCVVAGIMAAASLAGWLRAVDGPPTKLEAKEVSPPSVTEIEGKNLDQWIAETKHEDPSVREKAIRAIIHFGPAATVAVPALVDRCLDPDSSPRVRAIIALTLLEIQEKDRPKVIEALNKRLDDTPWDPQGIVRYHTVIALNRFGEEAKAAIPGLVKATADLSSFEIRRAAISALRRIARDPKAGPDPRATNALLKRLTAGVEPAGEVKIEAVMSLGAMGRPADPTLLAAVETTLKGFVHHKEKALSIWALVSLQALGEVSEHQLDAIAANAKNPDVDTRIHTARALGTVGIKAKTHAPVLVGLLRDKDPQVFEAACWALMNMGAPGEKAVAALQELADSKAPAETKVDPGRKAAAALALKGIEDYEKNKDKMDKKDEKRDK